MYKKKSFVAILFLSFFSFSFFTNSSSTAIIAVTNAINTGIVFFTGTWEEALVKAKAENKLIFLDIYATWCGPCKKLKTKTFTNAKVGTYFNAHFINVSLDGEIGEGFTLAEKFKLTAYPTLFFINADGNIQKGALGYYSSSEILRLAKSLK